MHIFIISNNSSIIINIKISNMTNIINKVIDVTNYFEYLKIHAFSDVKDHHTYDGTSRF